MNTEVDPEQMNKTHWTSQTNEQYACSVFVCSLPTLTSTLRSCVHYSNPVVSPTLPSWTSRPLSLPLCSLPSMALVKRISWKSLDRPSFAELSYTETLYDLEYT